ncbi:MAG: hypothetical protein K1W24_12875 [Lachnospiraceae bacterium]
MRKTDTGSTSPNRKYKDSVFTALFSSRESLFELYKVLHPEDTEVKINDIEKIALENVLLIRRYNDTAMGVKDKLIILSEHQSTINPNMPVRILLYIAEEYEKIIKRNGDYKSLYSSKLITLPAPEFYVVYTGNKECGDYMHLTDTFPEEYRDNSFLELDIKVIKDEDKNNILGGYIAFVKKAEKLKHTRGYTFTEALKEAVEWCREENILAGFMEERSGEMMELMLEEWNIEDAIKYNREDAWEDGMKNGMKKGMVYAYYEMNMNTNEIAKKVQLTEAEVLEIIKKKDMQ